MEKEEQLLSLVADLKASIDLERAGRGGGGREKREGGGGGGRKTGEGGGGGRETKEGGGGEEEERMSSGVVLNTEKAHRSEVAQLKKMLKKSEVGEEEGSEKLG